MTAEVARLNSAIRTANLNGSSPNELADQRDLLVLNIAKATGAVASDGENGVVNLTLAGRSLVMVDRSADLQVDGPTSYPGASGTVGVSWAATGQPAAVTSGVLSAQLDRRQRDHPGDDGRPRHRRQRPRDHGQLPAGGGLRRVRQPGRPDLRRDDGRDPLASS